MKRVFLLLMVLTFTVSVCGCYRSSYDDPEVIKRTCSENEELFREAALEAFTYGESTYISTYEYFRPEGADESLSGLYVYDNATRESRALESETIRRLLSECSVNSLGVLMEDGVRMCEFNMGGGRQYYNGVYYAEPDRPLFLNNFSVGLSEDGAGYSYSVENMNYYTEKIEDNFYFFVAKTK